ncbi:hypothetical protein HOLleu_42056 [Holothuria leucospilota]|uniref:Uncharacterized protein n=1 Tax=Holothuria leucospilota TaxID=206669 RepID=A0A9Q0YB98_HOLLE|nr:hypothetical protein HOLleu_42056 [Holothuria leucospilota]
MRGKVSRSKLISSVWMVFMVTTSMSFTAVSGTNVQLVDRTGRRVFQGLYHPVLPQRINDKLMFPLCVACASDENQGTCHHSDAERTLEGTWVSLELHKALKTGYTLIRIHEVSSFVAMDARLKHPFTCLVAGPTGSGKTLWVTHLLQHRHTIIHPVPENIVWFYGEFQKAYVDISRAIPNIRFVEGVPTDFDNYTDCESTNLFILDDLMSEIKSNQNVTHLFTKGSHHKNLSVIVLLQNLFQQGPRAAPSVSIPTIWLSSKTREMPLVSLIWLSKCIRETFASCKKPTGMPQLSRMDTYLSTSSPTQTNDCDYEQTSCPQMLTITSMSGKDKLHKDLTAVILLDYLNLLGNTDLTEEVILWIKICRQVTRRVKQTTLYQRIDWESIHID